MAKEWKLPAGRGLDSRIILAPQIDWMERNVHHRTWRCPECGQNIRLTTLECARCNFDWGVTIASNETEALRGTP